MRNRTGYLLIILAVIAIGFLPAIKVSNFVRNPSVDSNTYFLGTKDSAGGHYDYIFSAAGLSAFIGGGGIGANFANTDLTLTGPRDHDFAKYGMDWRNVYYFNFVDSNGDTIMSFNNFFDPHNSMIRISSYGSGSGLNFHTKNLRSSLALNGPSAVLNNGAASLFITSISGTSFARIGVAGVNPFTIDSATHLVTIGVCPNCITYNWITGAAIINGAYTLPLVDALSTDQFLTSNGAGIGSWSTISKLGLVTRYNGGAVAGNGVPAIRASTFHAGATTAAGIASITAAANVYEVGGYININSVTTDVLALRLVYTDVGGVVHSRDFAPNGSNASTLANVADYVFPRVEIMPQTGTTITLSAVLTTSGGSVNYDYSGHIIQLN